MLRTNRPVSAIVLMAVGIALLAFISVQIYLPTVSAPNYWENNTGDLVPLLLTGYIAASLLTGGISLGFEWVILRAQQGFDATRIRLTGLAAVLGGLLLVTGSFRFLFRAVSSPHLLLVSVNTGGTLLLILGVIGLYARYGRQNWNKARRGAALTAASLTVSTLGIVLSQFRIYGRARTAVFTEAAGYLGDIGGLFLLIGALLFGVRLRQQETVPDWIGGSLIAAVAVFVIVLVGRYHIVFWRLGEMIGFGIAAVAIGNRLLRNPTPEATPTVSSN